jgi:hypothetical protein
LQALSSRSSVTVARAGEDACRVIGAGTAPGEATGTAPGGRGEGALDCGMAGRAPRVRVRVDELTKALFAEQCNTLRRYLQFEGSLRFRAEYLFEYPVHAGVSDHLNRDSRMQWHWRRRGSRGRAQMELP